MIFVDLTTAQLQTIKMLKPALMSLAFLSSFKSGSEKKY